MPDQADFINGTFELLASFAILLTILKLYKAKSAKSVSVPHVVFFTVWGAWNLYFYPSLGQWFSAASGVLVMLVNGTWAGMLAYYARKEHKEAKNDG